MIFFINYLFKIFFIILIMWFLAILDIFIPFINHYGIQPRTLIGIPGIISSIFLHADLYSYSNHIINNTLMLLFLLPILAIFYEAIFQKVLWSIILLSGVLVWIFGRPYNHIGASGLIFGLITFLLFIGIFQRDIKSILCSFIFLVFYGVIFGNFDIWNNDLILFLKTLLSQIFFIFLIFFLIVGIFQRNIKYLLYFFLCLGLYIFTNPDSIQNFETLNLLGRQIFNGIFPTNKNISWEAHTFGTISGIFTAYLLSKNIKKIS